MVKAGSSWESQATMCTKIGIGQRMEMMQSQLVFGLTLGKRCNECVHSCKMILCQE